MYLNVFKFNPNHDPKNGRFTHAKMGSRGKSGDVVRTSNIDKAAAALAAGKKVELRQPKQVSTLLDKLASIARDAIAKGEKAPNYNLCDVTVKGTNLFCTHSKGIPRIKMPQLKGNPIAGSKGDALSRDERGEVDLSAQFRASLEAKGVKITDEVERADYLRATQGELNGVKVAGIANAIRNNKLADERLFISGDNYIVDGHHRWAATVGVDLDDNRSGDLTMKVARVNMDIILLLKEANDFATDWGIPQVSAKAMYTEVLKGVGKKCKRKGKQKPVMLAKADFLSVLKYNKNHDPKDGKFTSGKGGSGGVSAGDKKLLTAHRKRNTYWYGKPRSTEKSKLRGPGKTIARLKRTQAAFESGKTIYGAEQRYLSSSQDKKNRMRQKEATFNAAAKTVISVGKKHPVMAKVVEAARSGDATKLRRSIQYFTGAANRAKVQAAKVPLSDYQKISQLSWDLLSNDYVRKAENDLTDEKSDAMKSDFSKVFKYNKNHDPKNGRFTSKGKGGSGSGYTVGKHKTTGNKYSVFLDGKHVQGYPTKAKAQRVADNLAKSKAKNLARSRAYVASKIRQGLEAGADDYDPKMIKYIRDAQMLGMDMKTIGEKDPQKVTADQLVEQHTRAFNEWESIMGQRIKHENSKLVRDRKKVPELKVKEKLAHTNMRRLRDEVTALLGENQSDWVKAWEKARGEKWPWYKM